MPPRPRSELLCTAALLRIIAREHGLDIVEEDPAVREAGGMTTALGVVHAGSRLAAAVAAIEADGEVDPAEHKTLQHEAQLLRSLAAQLESIPVGKVRR